MSRTLRTATHPALEAVPGLVHGFEQRLGPAGWEERDESRRRVAQALAGLGPAPAPQAGARLPRPGRAVGGAAGSGRVRRGRKRADPRHRDRGLPAHPFRGSGAPPRGRRARGLARHGGGRGARDGRGHGRAWLASRRHRRRARTLASARAATRWERSCARSSVRRAETSSGPGRAASPISTFAPPTSASSSRPASPRSTSTTWPTARCAAPTCTTRTAGRAKARGG